MKRFLFTVGFSLLALAVTQTAAAQESDTRATQKFGIAQVISIESEHEEHTMDIPRTVQRVHLRMISGIDTGKEWTLDNAVLNEREDTFLATYYFFFLAPST